MASMTAVLLLGRSAMPEDAGPNPPPADSNTMVLRSKPFTMFTQNEIEISDPTPGINFISFQFYPPVTLSSYDLIRHFLDDGYKTSIHQHPKLSQAFPKSNSSYLFFKKCSGKDFTIINNQLYLVYSDNLNQYTVSVNSSEGGSTAPEGIYTISHGDILTITATANAGYHFTGWSGGMSPILPILSLCI